MSTRQRSPPRQRHVAEVQLRSKRGRIELHDIGDDRAAVSFSFALWPALLRTVLSGLVVKLVTDSSAEAHDYETDPTSSLQIGIIRCVFCMPFSEYRVARRVHCPVGAMPPRGPHRIFERAGNS